MFFKHNQEILLDLAYFALQEQPEHSLMVAISRTWHNGSYTMAAKPIKSLVMHYKMIQFLIRSFIEEVGMLKARRAYSGHEKKLEFQLALWISSSQILLALGKSQASLRPCPLGK